MSLVNKIKYYFFVKIRILKYQFLSDAKLLGVKPKLISPVLFSGKGKIILGKNIKFGYHQSPNFYSHYGYIEAREIDAIISIGNDVVINNACCIVALEKIEIQDNCVIGINFSLMDSNFHHLEPMKRHDQNPPSKAVIIKENVFIGNNVTILKGVTIGKNSVIGSNSLVTQSIPENTIVSGNPAQILKKL